MTGLRSPTAVVNWPGNPDIYVVAERGIGKVTVHDVNLIPVPPLLPVIPTLVDLSTEAFIPPAHCGQFDGITGIAFHPDFLIGTSNRYIYVRFGRAIPLHEMVIRRYYIRPGSLVAQASSAQDIYTWPTTSGIHSVGQIVFAEGINGAVLQFGIGDDFSPPTNCQKSVRSQDDNSDLGKVMGIAVDTNPMVRTVYAKGVRNPYALSVDRGDSLGNGQGDLWISDVGHTITGSFLQVPFGQSSVLNFGWPWQEGNNSLVTGVGAMYRPGPCHDDPNDPEPTPPPIYTDPSRVFSDVTWFAGGGGVGGGRSALVGGVVYRGAAIPSLQGRLVFATFGNLASGLQNGMVLHTQDIMPPTFGPGEGMAVDISSQLGIGNQSIVPPGHFILNLTQDIDGEILVLTGRCFFEGPNDRILRMVP